MASHEDSPHLAVVATLAAIALLTSLLRTYALGKHLRACSIDDVLAFFATLSLVGGLAVFIYCSRIFQGEFDAEGSQAWLLASKALHVVGIGLVKISILFFLLIMAVGKTFRRVLFVVVGFLIICTLFWFFSTLFRCLPVGDWWSNTEGPPDGRCMVPTMYFSFAVANNTTDAVTSIALVVMMLILTRRLTGPRPSRALLLVPFCFALVACSAAIVRTQIFFVYGSTRTRLPNHEQSTSLAAWGIIELSTALAAVNLLLLTLSADAFLPCLCKRRSIPIVPTPRTSMPPNIPSQNSRFSSTTVIYRPGTAYFPDEGRFHDTISNLDFDIEAPATRMSNHTILSPRLQTHSRNVSDWSQFSGFTYSASTIERSGEPDTSLVEMGEIIKELAGSEDRANGHDVRDEKATMGTCTTSDGKEGREVIIRTRSTNFSEVDDVDEKKREDRDSSDSEQESDDALSFIDIPRTRNSTARLSAYLEGSIALRQN